MICNLPIIIDRHFLLPRLYIFLNLNVTYNRKYEKYKHFGQRHYLFIFSLYLKKKNLILHHCVYIHMLM